jgi:hypothetical protein
MLFVENLFTEENYEEAEEDMNMNMNKDERLLIIKLKIQTIL